MKPIKDFAFGALYLVSGIYSIGFSLLMSGVARPVSGQIAYIPVPDALFPYEVMAFVLFGVAFIVASFYHFVSSLRELSGKRAEYISPNLI